MIERAARFLLLFAMLFALHGAQQTPNGISVGAPKVFDNRTLTIMLDNLSQTLNGMQVVDQKALAAALGMLNGMTTKDFTTNLQVSTVPTPGIVATTGATPSVQTTTPSVTPAIPTLDAAQTLSGFNPNYGPNSSDLLSDQINLQYQIFNLRMLLERSLSDRTLKGDPPSQSSNNNGGPRLQAVVGFNISVEPPRTAEDAVAVVEVTIEAANVLPELRNEGLSLVSVMPQEKTYNSAALSTKSHAYGGAAVAKMIQVGYNQRQRSEVFYLYRDADTVSYEMMTRESNSKVVFGWMFRPVLGRRSVSPGLRQMFAILSLPERDAPSLTSESIRLRTSVRTFWKKYDAGTSTAFEERDASRRSKFLYTLSGGLAKPEVFQRRYENIREFPELPVKSTSAYQEDLVPRIEAVRWTPVGSKAALVTVQGQNFFTGTQVALGDKTYATAADGMILKSNETFDILTTLDAIASGNAMVIGRYGPSVPMFPLVASGGAPDKPLIQTMSLGPDLGGFRTLKVEMSIGRPQDKILVLRHREGPTIPANPIITVNGKAIPPPYEACASVQQPVCIQAHVDSSLVSGASAAVKVTWPFMGPDWTAVKFANDPANVYEVARLGGNTILVKAKDPLGFSQPPQELHATGVWRILDGDKVLRLADLPQQHQAADRTAPASWKKKTPAARSAVVAGCRPKIANNSGNAFTYTFCDSVPDKLVMVSPFDTTFVLDIPKAAGGVPPAPGPDTITINQYDRVWIDIAAKDKRTFFTSVDPATGKVTNLVSQVEANQLSLPYAPPDPSARQPLNKLKVEVTQDISSHFGDVDITVLDAKKKVLGRQRIHVNAVSRKAAGEK